MRIPSRTILAAITATAMSASCPASIITWDGGGGDGLWATGANWDGGTVPVAGDDVFISNGDSVTGIEFNSAFNLTLSGNSSLTDPVTNFAGGVWRAGGATVTIESGSTLGSGGFWDFQNATLNFKDGAALNMSDWENKGTNVFNFELSATGFTTLTGANLRDNNTSRNQWTYNVDLANYTGGTGVITLVDYVSDLTNSDGVDTNSTSFTQSNLNVLNAGAYTANLQWNDTDEAIELNITAAAAVPEASEFGLACLGALGLVAFRRRKAQA